MKTTQPTKCDQTIPTQRHPLINTFLHYNSHINLSALRTPSDVYHKHIIDSLELNQILTLPTGSTIADIGTGGGFPLLPLAITNPDCHFTGIDARKKKITAVTNIAQDIGLTNTQLIRTRAEDHKQKYDYITARAVAYSNKLIPRLLPLCKPTTTIILYKQHTPEEHTTIIQQAKKHQLTIQKVHRYTLDIDTTPRTLYLLQK